nr:hypothetical protein DWF04_14405 [Cereibacter sphaeroides f. sp. denitrificans]
MTTAGGGGEVSSVSAGLTALRRWCLASAVVHAASGLVHPRGPAGREDVGQLQVEGAGPRSSPPPAPSPAGQDRPQVRSSVRFGRVANIACTGVMSPPALVVDGKLVSSGEVLTADVARLLRATPADPASATSAT